MVWVTKWECGYEAKILAMKNFCISISIKITWPLEHISDLSLSYSSSSFCLFMKDTCCNCFQSGCFPLLSKGNSFWRTLACVTKSTNSEIAFKLAIKCELSFNSFLFVIYGTSLLSKPWDVERIKEKKYIGKAINAGGKRTEFIGHDKLPQWLKPIVMYSSPGYTARSLKSRCQQTQICP